MFFFQIIWNLRILTSSYCKARDPEISLQQQFHLDDVPDDMPRSKPGVRTINLNIPENK